MFPLFESVKIENGHISNWDKHWKRMQNSARGLWGKELHFPTLYHELTRFSSPGLFKCKIKYNPFQYSIDVHAYQKRKLEYLQIVVDDDIDYSLKFTNRMCFEKHTQLLSVQKDILIVKHGFLSDTSYSNIALWNGNEWHTPQSPLLFGIRREVLLQEKKLIERNIALNDLVNYQKISLINAMLDLGEVELDIQQLINFPF